MPFSKPKFPNFTELSLTQETERLAIVISESGRRKKDMKAAGLKGLRKEMTVRKRSPKIFSLLKPRLNGRCKV